MKTKTFAFTAVVNDQDKDLFEMMPSIIEDRFEKTAVAVVGVREIASLESVEREIRSVAATVSNAVRVRRDHPTYGNSKASINRTFDSLRGMANLYAFLTGQTMNAQGIALQHVKFSDTATETMVQNAILDHGSL